MQDTDFYCLSKGAEPAWVSEFAFHPSLVTAKNLYPNAAWRDSSNFWTGRDGYKPIAMTIPTPKRGIYRLVTETL